MTPEQVQLVKTSFRAAVPFGDEVARAFYDHLFASAPSLRAMFKPDMEEQRQKLIMTLAVIVQHLDRLDILLLQATELARRHVGYGARDEHYALVGSALIETLRLKLAAAFTPEVEAAWGAAYGLLSEAMILSTKRAA